MGFFLSKNFCLAALTGILLWLAFPGGGGLWPLVFVALIPFFLVLHKSSLRTSVLGGLVCGMVHYLFLLYWVVIVLGKYGGLAWFISLQGLVLLALYMSFYSIVFAVLARIFFSVLPSSLVLWLLPSLWVGIDWFRGSFLTGFPWMDIGYSLYKVPLLIQIADLGGHHAVSFMIVFVNTLLFFLLVHRPTFWQTLLFFPGLVLLVAVIFYSGKRYEGLKEVLLENSAQKISIGIVQGNIRQDLKWSAELQEKTVETYVNLSKTLLDNNPPECIIWPETALPFYPPASELMVPLFDFVHESNTMVLTGAPWYEIVDRKSKKIKFFNSAVLLGTEGQFQGKYYKTHLVPFGEYVPFKKLLPFIAPLVEAVGDFTPGEIEKTITFGKAQAGILICFESVFPDLSRRWVDAGANILINLTNDAWYGKSSAPVQSLAMTVFRAVETRRSMVRSANTGISAFISPTGEIKEASEIFVPWAGKATLSLNDEKTVWVRYGHYFPFVCLIIVGVGLLLSGILMKNSDLD